MRQRLGVEQVATVLTSAPTDGDSTVGVPVASTSDFSGNMKVSKYVLWLTGTAAAKADVYVQHPTSGAWAFYQEVTLAQTRQVAVLDDLGGFDRVAVVQASGTVSTAKLQEYISNNFMRGD